MKASPFLQEILYLVAQFLRKSKQEDLANQLQQKIQLPSWIQHNNPLIKKGLSKIVKQYVKSQPKIQEYYQNRRPQDQENLEEEIVAPKRKRSSERLKKSMSPEVHNEIQKHSLNTPKEYAEGISTKNHQSSWMSKFQKPKRLEEIHREKIDEEKIQKEQVQVNKAKLAKKQKKAKIQSSDQESEEDSFEVLPKTKLKKQIKEEKVQKKQKFLTTNTEQKEVNLQTKAPLQPNNHQIRNLKQNNNEGPKKFFSRINVNQLQPIKSELMDNTFEAKAKFGQAADQWGKFGHEKLKDTRGDSFKKTKGKLKNKAFQGSLMDVDLINSIPIL